MGGGGGGAEDPYDITNICMNYKSKTYFASVFTLFVTTGDRLLFLHVIWMLSLAQNNL